MSDGVTVVIPIGPYEENTRWLHEAIQSIQSQTLKPTQVVFILDGCDGDKVIDAACDDGIGLNFRSYRPLWRLGVGHAFNFGVSLAETECVFMLGSDDVLEPECLERCITAYEGLGQADGYYYVPVQYMSGGHVQYDPCNAAMVTKGLWKLTGGFPVEAVTAPDAALISILMVHGPEMLIQVGDKPLYQYRSHVGTDTARHGAWHATDVIVQTRNLLTQEWTSPLWTSQFMETAPKVKA